MKNTKRLLAVALTAAMLVAIPLSNTVTAGSASTCTVGIYVVNNDHQLRVKHLEGIAPFGAHFLVSVHGGATDCGFGYPDPSQKP